MSLHSDISNQLINDFGERLVDLPRLNHDALEVRFDTGLVMQIRYPNLDEYSLRWNYRDRTLSIDTAPLHAELDSYPNHLHDRDGRIVPDRQTRPGHPVWDNLHPLIATLLNDPWLDTMADGVEHS